MYEHEGHLRMTDSITSHTNDVIYAIAEFIEKNPKIAVWTISSSHNGVVYIQCEGEEVLGEYLKTKGWVVNSLYLRLEVHPKTGE